MSWYFYFLVRQHSPLYKPARETLLGFSVQNFHKSTTSSKYPVKPDKKEHVRAHLSYFAFCQ
jgi:hypothetical protein